jgi:hypothetical protein
MEPGFISTLPRHEMGPERQPGRHGRFDGAAAWGVGLRALRTGSIGAFRFGRRLLR